MDERARPGGRACACRAVARAGFGFGRDRCRAAARGLNWVARYALEDDDWDAPVGRPWGAPDDDETPAVKPSPAPRGKRKLHPVLLLAIYAVAGIGLVVMASTALLGGSADPAPAEPPATRSTPEPVRTAEPTPEATGSVADDPAALEEARAAEAKARQDFRRERTRALGDRRDAVDEARAAARREARKRKRENRAPNRSGSGTPPPPSSTPQPTYTPPPASNPAPAPTAALEPRL